MRHLNEEENLAIRLLNNAGWPTECLEILHPHYIVTCLTRDSKAYVPSFGYIDLFSIAFEFNRSAYKSWIKDDTIPRALTIVELERCKEYNIPYVIPVSKLLGVYHLYGRYADIKEAEEVINVVSRYLQQYNMDYYICPVTDYSDDFTYHGVTQTLRVLTDSELERFKVS